MYVGSTLSFTAVALWFGKPAGLLLSLLVALVYLVAMRFEGPFTARIYEADAKRKRDRGLSSLDKRGATVQSAAAIEALKAEGGPARNLRSRSSHSNLAASTASATDSPSKAAKTTKRRPERS